MQLINSHKRRQQQHQNQLAVLINDEIIFSYFHLGTDCYSGVDLSASEMLSKMSQMMKLSNGGEKINFYIKEASVLFWI